MFVAHVAQAIVLAIEFRDYGAHLPSSVSAGVVVLFSVFIFGFATCALPSMSSFTHACTWSAKCSTSFGQGSSSPCSSSALPRAPLLLIMSASGAHGRICWHHIMRTLAVLCEVAGELSGEACCLVVTC